MIEIITTPDKFKSVTRGKPISCLSCQALINEMDRLPIVRIESSCYEPVYFHQECALKFSELAGEKLKEKE